MPRYNKNDSMNHVRIKLSYQLQITSIVKKNFFNNRIPF